MVCSSCSSPAVALLYSMFPGNLKGIAVGLHFEIPGQPSLGVSPAINSHCVCPFESKHGLTHLCQCEAEKHIFQVQDSLHLFLWRSQTHENQSSQVSSQTGKVDSRVTGGASECLSLQAQAIWAAIPPLFTGPLGIV